MNIVKQETDVLDPLDKVYDSIPSKIDKGYDITLTKNEDGTLDIQMSEKIDITDFLQTLCTGILASMRQVVKNTKAEHQEQCKEDLYDMFNAAASNTLKYFAPEIDMRPHLTTEAILKAENEILESLSEGELQYALQKD